MRNPRWAQLSKSHGKLVTVLMLATMPRDIFNRSLAIGASDEAVADQTLHDALSRFPESLGRISGDLRSACPLHLSARPGIGRD